MRKETSKEIEKELSQYFEDKKDKGLKDEAVVVAKNLLEKAEFTAVHLKQVADDAAQEAVERTLTKRSASDSNIMKEVIELRKEVAQMKETLDGWKSGTKIAFWGFVFIGGIITWVLNSFGIKFGIK